MATKALKPTPAVQWRQANEGKVVELPSGLAARVRPVSADVFVKLGKVPDALTPVITQAILGAGLELKVEKFEDVKTTLQLLDAICELCFVEPKVAVGREPTENEITLDDIPLEDKFALLELFMMPASKLASFRPKSGAGLEPLPDGEGNGAGPQPDVADQPVGERADGTP